MLSRYARGKCWNRWQINGQETWEYEEAIDANGTLRPQNRNADYNVNSLEEIQVLYWKNQAAFVPWVPSAVEETKANAWSATKLIRNGQMFIRVHDREYNLLGTGMN